MNNKLSIQDLVSALSERYGMDAKSAGTFVRTVFEIVEEYISKDKLVKIKGLGTFKLVSVSDRESVNVNTGERILIAGHGKLSFTPDAALKDAVNRPFSDFETTPLRDTTSTEDMERIPSAEAMDTVTDADEDTDAEGLSDGGQVVEPSVEQPAHVDVEPLPVMNEEAGQEEVDSIPASSEDVENVSAIIDNQEDNTAASIDGAECHDDESISDDVETEPVSEAEPQDVRPEKVDVDRQEGIVLSPTSVAADVAQTTNDGHAKENDAYPLAAESLAPTDTDGHRMPGWAYAVLTLLLMAGSYFLGYYRMLDKLEISLYPEEEVGDSPKENPVGNGAPVTMQPVADSLIVNVEEDSLSRDSLSVDTLAVAPKVAEAQDEDPAEVAKYFPQVPNGEYWIVGDAGHVHYLEMGETLSKVARMELGDGNLVRYIIKFNDFEDPNVVHTGEAIRIPKLVKK